MDTPNPTLEAPQKPAGTLQLLLYALASAVMPFVAAAVLLLIGKS